MLYVCTLQVCPWKKPLPPDSHSMQGGLMLQGTGFGSARHVKGIPLIMCTCKFTPPQTPPFFSLEHREVFWKAQPAKQKEMTVVFWCHTYVWQHACKPSVVILTLQEVCFCLFQISAWRIICQRMSGACVRFSANVNRERLRLWSQLKSCGNQKNILMYRPKSSRKEKWAALLISILLVYWC